MVTTLKNFVRLFMHSHEEKCKELYLEKKKTKKEAKLEKAKQESENEKAQAGSESEKSEREWGHEKPMLS